MTIPAQSLYHALSSCFYRIARGLEMDLDHEAGRLIDRIGLRHPCDLDLFIFFVRHPRSLIASERLATFLGYELERVSQSLEVLLGAGLLTRTPNPSHAARMYVFDMGGPDWGWLPELLRLATAREGRLTLRRKLAERAAESNGPAPRADSGAPKATRGPLPSPVRQPPEPIDDAERRARRTGERS